jgi:hypothetical protein
MTVAFRLPALTWSACNLDETASTVLDETASTVLDEIASTALGSCILFVFHNV